MPYIDISQLIPISEIPSNLNIDAPTISNSKCIFDSPYDDIYISRNNNKLIYMDGEKFRGIYNTPAYNDDYLYYYEVEGR